jgi:hypothetical protein
MKYGILSLLLFVSASTTPANAARLERATVTQKNVTNFAGEMRQLVASKTPVWISWDMPTNDPDAQMCCFSSVEEGEKRNWRGGRCSLADKRGSFNVGSVADAPPVKRETFTIFVRAAKGEVLQVRMFSEDCAVDAAGLTITHLNGVSVADSVRWLENAGSHEAIAALAMHRGTEGLDALERMVKRGETHAAFWLGHKGGSRGRRFLRAVIDDTDSHEMIDQAVVGIAQDDDREATDMLLSMAKTHRLPQVRKQSIFWLGQRAGTKATAHLKEAADDPNSEVREMAVFAISQLPADRAVPELIQLAKTHRSKGVREKAIFWLGQSGDPRALDFIEEILTK